MPFSYRFDPISGSFTLQPTETVESPPYWVDTSNPTVREYIEKFGAPPKGMTVYEMKIALEEDQRRQRRNAEEQFWNLIQTGAYVQAQRFAQSNPYLGPEYVRYARQQFKQARESRQQEKAQKAKASWMLDPYINMALRQLGLNPEEAYNNPILRAQVEGTAVQKAKEMAEHYAQYGASDTMGQDYLAISRAYRRLEQQGLTGFQKAKKAHQGGSKLNRIYPSGSGSSTKAQAQGSGTYVLYQAPDGSLKKYYTSAAQPLTGMAGEKLPVGSIPGATPVKYERDPETGYVVPVYDRGDLGKQLSSAGSQPKSQGSGKQSSLSNEEFYQQYGIPKGLLYGY